MYVNKNLTPTTSRAIEHQQRQQQCFISLERIFTTEAGARLLNYVHNTCNNLTWRLLHQFGNKMNMYPVPRWKAAGLKHGWTAWRGRPRATPMSPPHAYYRVRIREYFSSNKSLFPHSNSNRRNLPVLA